MLLYFVENSNGYESVFPENHPYLKSDIIYVLDLGKEKNKELNRKGNLSFFGPVMIFSRISLEFTPGLTPTGVQMRKEKA